MIHRRLVIETDHPNAEKIIAQAAEQLADRLDRRNVKFTVRVEDPVGAVFLDLSNEEAATAERSPYNC